MGSSSISEMVVDIPKLVVRPALQPIRVAMRSSKEHPETQSELAHLVENSLRHEIRAGYDHRFITLMFVTVGYRVFCRRYQYTEPSWHGVFLSNPKGQLKLDKTIVNIEARPPEDLEQITPAIDAAYAAKLKQYGARFMLAGGIEERAQASTLEIHLDDGPAHL